MKKVIIMCVLLFCACLGQQDNILKFNTIYDLQLNANGTITYQINIPDTFNGHANLYISGYSPINDPLQQPKLKIKSDVYQLKCQAQSSNLNQVCFVPTQYLARDKKFTVQASCQINCKAKLVAYLSKTVELDLGEQILIQTKDSPVQSLFKIYVPPSLLFTTIQLFINVQTENPKQTAAMYIKSSSNNQLPTTQLHDTIPTFNWGQNKVAILRKGLHIKQGQSIYVLLSIGSQIAVKFESRIGSDNNRYLQINQKYQDYLNIPNLSRTYTLDLTTTVQTFDLPIIIQIKQYSGSPQIEVSLTPQFKQTQLIKPSTSSSWIRFEFTANMFKTQSFNKKLYIRISSTYGASYVINSRYKMNQFDSIQKGMSQYIQIKPNQIGSLVYRFDSQLNITQQVQIIVQNQLDNYYQLSAYLCQQSNIYNCKIKNKQISNMYKELPIKQTRLSIQIQYNSVDCNKNTGVDQSSQDYASCTMVFVITPADNTKIGKYALTIKQQTKIYLLSQGRQFAYSVNKQQYKYLAYYLPNPKGQEDQILQLVLYVNTLDGYVKIFASKQVVMPTLQNINDPNVKSSLTHISFGRYILTAGTYYFSIYGLTYADFIANIIIRKQPKQQNQLIRINNLQKLSQTITSTSIQLKDSIAQTYQLDKGTFKINFKIKTVGIGNITLTITQLIGSVVTYITRQNNHTRQLCVNNQCIINLSRIQQFYLEVSGSQSTVRKFNIVYKQYKQCYKFPIGAPIYVQLQTNDTQCFQFLIQTSSALQISNSLTNLQILNRDTQIIITFQPNITLLMSTNTFLLQSTDLLKYCNNKQQCLLKIKFISKDIPIYVQFVIQNLDGIITLYDGVVQRMNTVINQQIYKYFRFPIDIEQSVDIFLHSDTDSDYVITAILVQGVDSTNINKIQQYIKKNVSVWTIQNSIDSPSLTLLPISKFKLKNAVIKLDLQVPWLIVLISGKGKQQTQHVIFTIDITQNQRILRQGQQHIGFLQPMEIIMYELYVMKDSLLSIRSLHNYKCYKLLDQNKQEIFNQDIYLQKPRNSPVKYYLAAFQATNCIYQISLQDFQSSVLTLTQGYPTRVILQYNQKTFFLYYHKNNITFHVYQFITSGLSTLYATPLNIQTTKSIQQQIQDLRLNDYQYKTDIINNIEIKATFNNTAYCFNCYYVIAVHGQPAVQEQIVVVQDNTPVMIKDHMIVDSYLDIGEKEQFIYYTGSLSKFNLSIDVVYGRVTVTVRKYDKKPQGQIVRIQSVAKSMVTIPVVTQINIAKPQVPTDYLNQQNKYKIFVQSIQNSSYHLQIVKFEQSYKIVQGVSSKIKVPAHGSINLQFDNYIEQDNIQLNIQTVYFDNNPLMVDVFYYGIAESKKDQVRVMADIMHIGRVTFLSFKSLRGHFIIKLGNLFNTPFDIVATIPRPGIMQLREMHQTVSKKQNIFQIYIEDNSYAIIQVFGCQGNFKVRGSNDYNAVKRAQKKKADLLHQNIGGHYVITTPVNTTGQYFLRVQNKQYQASINEQVSGLAYMIRHRILNNTRKNPYQALDAQSFKLKISTSQSLQNITVRLNKIKSLDDSIKIKKIKYIFTIGKSADDVQNYMICQTSSDTKHLIFVQVVSQNQQFVQLNVSKMEVLKRVGDKVDAYIGVLGLALVQYSDNQLSGDYVFVYEPSFIGQLKSRKVITGTGFFEIMVIISTVIGGLVIIYALGVQAIKIYRGYNNTNELIEEQSVQKNKNAGISEMQINQNQNQIIQAHEQKIN